MCRFLWLFFLLPYPIGSSTRHNTCSLNKLEVESTYWTCTPILFLPSRRLSTQPRFLNSVPSCHVSQTSLVNATLVCKRVTGCQTATRKVKFLRAFVT
ncbi:hypothetical protein BaRGS_00022424 [Batillaria attramentaria]|uniref:Secreted protein n=1 Tax=Batillaria attramentaria TaxID=370345 RepID=A0ABD0KH42_9CAEN